MPDNIGVMQEENAIHDPLEKIAHILVEFYPPIGIIEHKYRTKVTAVGLLRKAGMRSPIYIDFYYQRLLSYKLLVADHIDNIRLSLQSALAIFREIILTIYHRALREKNNHASFCFDHLLSLIDPEYLGAAERKADRIRRGFFQSMSDPQESMRIAAHILKTYLGSREMYDLLAQQIIRCCLTGVKQQDIADILSKAKFNYFVYGRKPDREGRLGYEVMLKPEATMENKGFFTKINLLARAIINEVESESATISFFGTLKDDYDDIRKLFGKNPEIRVLFF